MPFLYWVLAGEHQQAKTFAPGACSLRFVHTFFSDLLVPTFLTFLLSGL